MTYQLLQSLTEADQSLLLYLNGLHNTFGDYFMPVFTGKWIWVPMYAGILYVLLKNYNWKVTLLCLIAITLTITFADQVCATLIRPIVERPRSSNPASPIADLVHIVNGRRGGGFGFPSCHASNSFGLAFFLVFLFRKRWLSLFICIWATVKYAFPLSRFSPWCVPSSIATVFDSQLNTTSLSAVTIPNILGKVKNAK